MQFTPDLVELTSKTKTESDEGDRDECKTSILRYDGKQIWEHTTSEHSNIGGAWGSDHTCTLTEDKEKLILKVYKVSGDVYTGRSAELLTTESVDVKALSQPNQN